MEFKHFTPIQDVKPKSVIPNFTNFDTNNIRKNLPRLEQIAISSGLVAGKGLIMGNTLKAAKLAQDQPLSRVAYGDLGFPIYSNLVIAAGSYQDNAGATLGKYPEITLNAVLMEIEAENNIITTDIQGRNGTVIEYVGAKSPKVHIFGTILTKGVGAYPRTDVQNLMTALYSNRSLQVTSWFLTMCGINALMVIRSSIKQEEGSQEYQKFEFDAFADLPVVLKLQKSNIDNLSTSPIT